jgi:hypothetical protein
MPQSLVDCGQFALTLASAETTFPSTHFFEHEPVLGDPALEFEFVRRALSGLQRPGLRCRALRVSEAVEQPGLMERR